MRMRPFKLVVIFALALLTSIAFATYFAYRQRATVLQMWHPAWNEQASAILMSGDGQLAFVTNELGVSVAYWAPQNDGIPLKDVERKKYRSPPHWMWMYRGLVDRPDEHHTDLIVASGWPLRCLVGWEQTVHTTGQRVTNLSFIHDVTRAARPADYPSGNPPVGAIMTVKIPMLPDPIGIIGNTVFFAGICWIIGSLPVLAIAFVRRRRGRCARCGYDLRGAKTQRCPECGRDDKSS